MKAAVAACLESARRTEQGVRAVFRFPSDLPIFAGHFPGRPLVPGVFLIEAVRSGCERALGQALALEEVDEAKFTREVLPGEQVSVEAVLGELEPGAAWSCRARIAVGEAPAATIRLRGTCTA